jgi:elongation factor P--beta-lysine ligase
MLNDPQVLEASRVLAQQMLSTGKTEEMLIEEAFRRIVCRKPSDKERNALKEYHQLEVKRFSADKKRAEKFIHVGEYPAAKGLDPTRHAALMQVIHMIYNLEETTVKS